MLLKTQAGFIYIIIFKGCVKIKNGFTWVLFILLMILIGVLGVSSYNKIQNGKFKVDKTGEIFNQYFGPKYCGGNVLYLVSRNNSIVMVDENNKPLTCSKI